MLKTLRKLPRYHLDKTKPYLYRCISRKVAINYDQYDTKIVPYITGNIKTFWAFTSTSPNVMIDFVGDDKNKNIKCGTIFTLYGDVRGYDISLFNCYNENEILLEPERKFNVEQIIPPVNEIIHIRCSFIETPLVIEKFDTVDIYKQILIDEIDLSFDLFDSKGDKSFGKSNYKRRGGEIYIPPSEGWEGIGLKVLGKHKNNDWISGKDTKEQYPVAYYGYHNYLNDKNISKKEIKDYVQDIRKIETENIFNEEKNKRSGFWGLLKDECKEGVCLFQDPKYAECCAGEMNLNGDLYKIILMCRVKACKIRQPSIHDNFGY